MSSDPGSELKTWQSRVYRRTLIAVLVGIVILVLLGVGVGFAVIQLTEETDFRFTEVWQKAEIGWIALATLCVLLGTASHGPRMRPLLPTKQGDVPRLTELGSLYLGASVLNLSFPGPAGEVAAGVVLQRTHQMPATMVIASSLHARFVALLVAAVVTLISLPFVSIPEELQIYVYLGAGVLGVGGLILGILSFSPHQLRRLSALLFGRKANPEGQGLAKILAKIDGQVQSFAEALALVPKQGLWAYVNAAAWSFASLLVSFLAILCAAQAFGLQPEPVGTFMTLCLTLIAAVALIIVPGGLGSFDLVLVTSLNASAGASWTEACLILWGVRLAQVLSIALALVFFRRWARDFLAAETIQRIEKGGI